MPENGKMDKLSFQAKIGEVVISISVLDFYIDLLIRDLIKVDDKTAHILLADITWKNKLDLLSRLYLENVTNYNKEEFRQMVNNLTIIRVKRNELMHSLYVHNTNGGLSLVSKKKRKTKIYHDFKPINENSIGELLSLINNTRESLEMHHTLLNKD